MNSSAFSGLLIRIRNAPMISPTKEPTSGTSEVTPMTMEITSACGNWKMRMPI